MKFNLKSVAGQVGAAIAVVFPLVAAAQGGGGGVPVPTDVLTGGISDVYGWVSTLANWLFGLVLALAVIFILYAAFMYLTSGGDEEKVKKAKQFLVYAIIAIAIGLLARGIVALVQTFFGQSVQTPT